MGLQRAGGRRQDDGITQQTDFGGGCASLNCVEMPSTGLLRCLAGKGKPGNLSSLPRTSGKRKEELTPHLSSDLYTRAIV